MHPNEFPLDLIVNGQRVIDLHPKPDVFHRSGTITNVRWIYGEVAFDIIWDEGGKLYLWHPTRTIGVHP